MSKEDLAVLVVEGSKDAHSAMKLVPPSKLKVKHDQSITQFKLHANNLKVLLGNLDL
jgi:hypothetical protein